MAEIVFDAVTKRFGEVAAVSELSLTVNEGAFVVLLGPTGAGKTTTLRLLAGLERPDLGRISIGGVDMTAEPPAARDVAFVFQQYSLYPHYTVYENLAFPLRAPARRWPEDRIRERVENVASVLRIEHKLKNAATQLSGGEMQRVAIGRALVRTPSVFLMDEPLSSLDAKLREELRVELKRIQRELGATILYVTHDQLEAMTLADRIGVLSEGRLVQFGTPRDVYTRPDTVYVAQRLGSPQINLLPVEALGLAGPAGTEQLGIRAEDVRLGTGTIEAKVLTAEHLGAETVLLLQVGTHRLHALAGGHDYLRPGDTTNIAVEPETVLHFGADRRRLDMVVPSRPVEHKERTYG